MGIGGAPVTPVDKDGNVIGPSGGTGPGAAQLPATLGAKTGALSLSVVPNTNTAFPVVGNVARGAAVAGAPVLVGGRGRSTTPSAVSNDQVIEPWLSSNGATMVGHVSDVVTPVVTPYAGFLPDTVGTSYPLAVQGFVYSGGSRFVRAGNAVGGFVVNKPDTTGGLTPARIVTGTTGFIKATPGQPYKAIVYNANAAVRYLHLYNKATAPTLSTDTPIITIPILGTGQRDVDLTVYGVAFSTGIAWAFTTDDAAIPTTAGASGELHATILYN